MGPMCDDDHPMSLRSNLTLTSAQDTEIAGLPSCACGGCSRKLTFAKVVDSEASEAVSGFNVGVIGHCPQVAIDATLKYVLSS